MVSGNVSIGAAHAADAPPRARTRSLRRNAAIGALIALLLLFTLAAAIVSTLPAHRWPPSPAGMVLRVVLPEVAAPYSQTMVDVADFGQPAIAITMPPSRDDGRTRFVYAYPSGELLETVTFVAAEESAADERWFDFDGDGSGDTIQIGSRPDHGLVRVISGASGAVLLEDRDDIEYLSDERAFPLGDLDGDGFGELALVHPRMNRSRYDPEPWDWLLGANSWVTVVSGSRIAWR